MINIFLNRIFRAIKIDIELFEEVEKDKKATFQAGVVVVLSSLAAGVGSIHLGVSNFLVAPALSLLSWYVWAYVIYFVGVKLFRNALRHPSIASPYSDICLSQGSSDSWASIPLRSAVFRCKRALRNDENIDAPPPDQ